jgi:hypothetical protein
MGVNRPTGRFLVQKSFTVPAPQESVWEPLGRVIYQSLPLERINLVNEKLFYADVLLKTIIPLKFHLKVALKDVDPPRMMVCAISTKKGPVKIKLKVRFEIQAAGTDQTKVSCRVEEGGLNPLLRIAFRRQLSKFAFRTLNSVETQLYQSCTAQI